MTDAISTFVGRVGFAAVAGIGLGLAFGQSWWIGVGATLLFSSFPECLGVNLGSLNTPSEDDITDYLDRMVVADNDELLS